MADRDPAALRDAAHRILGRPEFRQPPESPIDRARHWLGEQLAKALDAVLAGHLGVLGAIVLLAIVALLVWLTVRAARAVRRDVARTGVVVGGTRRPPADWLAEAAACEAAGDYRGALRARYRALVAELAGRGLVDEIPGRTSGEYRVEVAASLPSAAAEFAGATDLFERAVYGHADAGPAEAGRIRELADLVRSRAR